MARTHQPKCKCPKCIRFRKDLDFFILRYQALRDAKAGEYWLTETPYAAYILTPPRARYAGERKVILTLSKPGA